jgi:RyR domain
MIMEVARDALKNVVVTGDVTIDWHFARYLQGNSDPATWTAEDCAGAGQQLGGAALLAEVMETIASLAGQDGEAAYRVLQTGVPRDPVSPADDHFHHSYALWSRFSLRDKGKRAWRVERFLGLDRGQCANAAGVQNWQRVVDDPPEAELVLLDDANLGFRDQPALWPRALQATARLPWILVKMAHPVAQGALWDLLQAKHTERLVIVMPLEDLRRTQVQISRGLSWERTAQDLVWELVHNPHVNALARCAGVVISLGPVGAVCLSRLNADGTVRSEAVAPECSLFFDPELLEGAWEQGYPGGMIGSTTCLTTALAWQLLRTPEQPDLAQAIQSGIAAMRMLHQEGYTPDPSAAPHTRLRFPTQRIAVETTKSGAPLAMATIPDPGRLLNRPERMQTGGQATAQASGERGFWTILHDHYRDNLGLVARQVTVLTVDRREIESYRSIRALIDEYCRQERTGHPLSIAVFGAPGSGKSFGVKEVARSLLAGQLSILEFNLAQFASIEELASALHLVRDESLRGRIPLVFWDEFDTSLAEQPLGWLRYFLSPMQDGSFREGQSVHPIGRAIFVFAGGTSHALERFGHNLDKDVFVQAKGPDFVSRLQGYVNVLGPNRQPTLHDGANAEHSADPYYLIRRAILLRSLLKRHAPHLFWQKDGKEVLLIDPGVLRAFLEIRSYKHGARSMEAIISMSRLEHQASFEQSSLPPEAQLDLHVDGQEFLSLVQWLELQGPLLEQLAEAAHEVFCSALRVQGYRRGPVIDPVNKTHPALKPYTELPEEEKEQNRGTVRDIPAKLAERGYLMLPARGAGEPFTFPAEDVERMAEREHLRWLRAKLAAGWRYAPVTDKAHQRHQDIVPWHQLSEEEIVAGFTPDERAAMGPGELPEAEREKDRVLVRAIPAILAQAGYTMVKLEKPPALEESKAEKGVLV